MFCPGPAGFSIPTGWVAGRSVKTSRKGPVPGLVGVRPCLAVLVWGWHRVNSIRRSRQKANRVLLMKAPSSESIHRWETERGRSAPPAPPRQATAPGFNSGVYLVPPEQGAVPNL